jgi:hypothetical protein
VAEGRLLESQVNKARAELARLIEASSAFTQNEIHAIVPFTFATPSPQMLVPLAAGTAFSRITLLITVPFSGGVAELQLGTAAFPKLFFDLTDGDLTAQQYNFEELVQIPAPDHLLLTLSPGLTAGSATLLYEGFLP